MWKGWLIIEADKEKDIQVIKPFKGSSRNDIKKQISEFLSKKDRSSLLEYDMKILLKSPENPLMKPIYLPYNLEPTVTPMLGNLNDRCKNILVDSSYYLPQYAN